MHYKEPIGRRIFIVCNYIFLGFAAITCILPIVHILAISLSSESPVRAGMVGIWPIGFTISSYQFVMRDAKFYMAFFMTIKRCILGVIISMVLTLLAGYPLSKSARVFRARQFYIWYFVITMLFGGGLIPTYLIVSETGLIDSIFALVIPIAVPTFNVILLQNFFKDLPGEISESAFIDGAGHWTVLFKIMTPLSKPVLATLTLFVLVSHWNAWFDGMIYMNRPANYPLQTYLQTIVVDIDMRLVDDISQLENLCEKNSKAAQIFIAMFPIICVYPFLQKYFTKGIILGSVKG